jgi:hypothetical protein
MLRGACYQPGVLETSEDRKRLKDLAGPQGFEPRYADPELMDRKGRNSWFHADESIAYLQRKPARKHFAEVLKRLDLAHTVSKRTAHLSHTFSRGRMKP